MTVRKPLVNIAGTISELPTGDTITGGGGSIAVDAVTETPTGTVDGSNVTFVLSNPPATGQVVLSINGLIQKKTTDYTISGSTITFTSAPPTGSNIQAFYVTYFTVVSGIQQTTIDMGTLPVLSKQFSITDSNVVTGNKIQIWFHNKVGFPVDELEADLPHISANCTTNGLINIFVSCKYFINGVYTINYLLG